MQSPEVFVGLTPGVGLCASSTELQLACPETCGMCSTQEQSTGNSASSTKDSRSIGTEYLGLWLRRPEC